jgi:hypothetical protein
VLLVKEERDVASACVRARQPARERWQSACEWRSLGAHAKTVSVRLGHNARVRACGGAALQVMLAARHGDPAVGVGCRAWEPSDAWARGSRRDAMHECMRHERGHMHGSQASAQTRVLLGSDQKGKDDRWGLPVSSKKEGEGELG